MRTSARFYAIAVIAAGFGLAALFAAADWRLPETSRFLCLLLLASLAATLKIKVPAVNGTISLNFVFVLIAVAELNLTETLILGFVATLLQSVWKMKTRPSPIQVLFNIAAVELSVLTAYHLPNLFAERRDQVAALALSACVFFIANAGLISIVMSLAEGKPLAQIWRQCFLWTFPYYLIGAGIAGAVSISVQSANSLEPLLILPLTYLIYRYYRLCLASREVAVWG